MENAEASGQFLVLETWSTMMFPIMVESLPPTSRGTAYAPKIGMKVKMNAVLKPLLMFGNMTFTIASSLVAPKS